MLKREINTPSFTNSERFKDFTKFLIREFREFKNQPSSLCFNWILRKAESCIERRERSVIQFIFYDSIQIRKKKKKEKKNETDKGKNGKKEEKELLKGTTGEREREMNFLLWNEIFVRFKHIYAVSAAWLFEKESERRNEWNFRYTYECICTEYNNART